MGVSLPRRPRHRSRVCVIAGGRKRRGQAPTVARSKVLAPSWPYVQSWRQQVESAAPSVPTATGRSGWLEGGLRIRRRSCPVSVDLSRPEETRTDLDLILTPFVRHTLHTDDTETGPPPGSTRASHSRGSQPPAATITSKSVIRNEELMQSPRPGVDIQEHTTYKPIAPTHSLKAYRELYQKSLEKPDEFWREQAHKYLHWFKDFDRVSQGSFEQGDVAWFLNGKLNASVCCIDQHLPQREDQVAIIWEGDEPGDCKYITYKELYRDVCKLANAMKAQGVKKGDVVMIYMPMIPEIVTTMLACTRIGAPHSVVFAGFSAEAVRDRVIDAHSKWIFTADEGKRGGKTIPLKQIIDKALEQTPSVEKCFVFERTGAKVNWVEGRDVRMAELLAAQRPYCPAELMDSEDLLFILYTSGSTGKPKGVAHTTAGYLLYAAMTQKTVFDIQEGDVYACVADCGWITGHSYIVYGPLVNGCTTVLFESVPTYPNHCRYWDLIQRHKVTQFYTAPTAIRALMRFGTEDIATFDRSTLRVLGSVGEPINPEAWRWYFEHVGDKRCTIVDTWWQTETGGHLCSPLPGITPMKPGSCTLPFFGIELALVDPATGKEMAGNEVEGVLCVKRPWPSMTRTVYGDHERYLTVYMKPYKGYYFTGDGARRDQDGYYWITGRVDDVLNTSGHRIGTAEVESALVAHAAVAEAAVVGYPHQVKGEGICCFVTLREGEKESPQLETSLKMAVREAIGAFATPDIIVCTPAFPKTRSGKIMRRILRKIAAGEAESLGDVSTLADPSVVDFLIAAVGLKLHKA